RRHRLLRGGHHRHPAGRVHRAPDDQVCHLDGGAGVLRGDPARVHLRHRGARLLAHPRVLRPDDGAGRRPDRDRRDQRPVAAELRRCPARRRGGRCGGRRRHLRPGRGAVGRRPSASPGRGGDPGRSAVHGQAGLEALLETLAARHRPGLPLRRVAGRRGRDPDLPLLHPGEEAEQAPRGVRSRGDRGRRGSGSSEQRLRGGHVRAHAVARPAHQRHCGRDAGSPAVVRHPAGSAAAAEGERAGLGSAGQLVHRQHPAGPAQPAARSDVGEAAADTPPAPLRRHPVLRRDGRLCGERLSVRPDLAARARHRRLRDASLRHSGAAADRRGDHGPAAGAPGSPRPPAGRRQSARPARGSGPGDGSVRVLATGPDRLPDHPARLDLAPGARADQAPATRTAQRRLDPIPRHNRRNAPM
ncbi:MAG: Tripartite tricarboxylate transporter TctA family, partial [uncultured Friedmanniella sp.]